MICLSCYEALENANYIRNLCLKSKQQLEELVTSVKCCLCCRDFDNFDQLLEHAWEAHKMRSNKKTVYVTHQCQICLLKFENRMERDLHRTCEVCFESCSNDDSLKRHKVCHGVVKKGHEVVCEVSVLTKETVFEQKNSVEVERPKSMTPETDPSKKRKLYSCCHCALRFTNKRDRDDHFTDKHKDAIKSNPNPSKYACYICGEDFSSVKDRVTHIRNGSGSFKCTQCPLAFKNQRCISKHYELDHKIPQVYHCPLCVNKTFTKVVSYDSHIHHYHSALSKYKCEKCHKIFNRKHDLTEHMNAHLGRKPYQCHVCAARFARRTGLNVHLRSHTGRKPYQCKYCEKQYGHYTDWKR